MVTPDLKESSFKCYELLYNTHSGTAALPLSSWIYYKKPIKSCNVPTKAHSIIANSQRWTAVVWPPNSALNDLNVSLHKIWGRLALEAACTLQQPVQGLAKISPYPEETSSHLLTCDRYSIGHVAWLCHSRLGCHSYSPADRAACQCHAEEIGQATPLFLSQNRFNKRKP